MKAGDSLLSAGERDVFAIIGSLPLESGDLAGLVTVAAYKLHIRRSKIK